MPGGAAVRPRRTVRRELVRRALEQHDEFVSAPQLRLGLTRTGARVGLATVYRHLAALAEFGQADTILTTAGQLYRACASTEHHHHLICKACGQAIEVAAPDEVWLETIAHEHGFTIDHHVTTTFGRCAQCEVSN